MKRRRLEAGERLPLRGATNGGGILRGAPREVVGARDPRVAVGLFGEVIRELSPRIVAREQERRLRERLGSAEFAERYRRFVPDLRVPEFHRVWYRALDGAFDRREGGRIFILAPRNHGKTSVVLTFCLRCLIYERQTMIGIVSQTDALARNFMRDIAMEMERNERIQADFGLLKPKYPEKWNEREIIVLGGRSGKEVSLWAAGAGTQITGRRADLLVADDIESAETVKTPESRARTREWWAREVQNVLEPRGLIVAIGTRKSHDDLYARFLAADSGWTVLDNAPAALVPGRDGKPRPLWPEKWPLAELMAQKAQLDAVDTLAWAQEWLNNPLPDDTRMFAPQHWPVFEWADA